MDYWLPLTLARMQQDLIELKSAAHETTILLHRIAILGTLWGAAATLGYNSPAAQELLSSVIKAVLHR